MKQTHSSADLGVKGGEGGDQWTKQLGKQDTSVHLTTVCRLGESMRVWVGVLESGKDSVNVCVGVCVSECAFVCLRVRMSV